MWKDKYIKRLKVELKKKKKTEKGNKICSIYVYDLLEESGLSKKEFYKIVFNINRNIDKQIVLYLNSN